MENHFFSKMLVLFSLLLSCLLLNGCNLLSMGAQVAMIKLQFGCLPEGTYLDTPDGPVVLEAIEVGDVITGYSGNPVKVLQKHAYLEDPLNTAYVQISFENGASVSASELHRIANVPAKMIRQGDVIAGQKVIAAHQFYDISKSYDLLTEDAGYQIEGIPVNSMIGEMQVAMQQQ